MGKNILYAAFILLLTLKSVDAEIIDIEEAIPQISLQDSIIRRFTIDFDGEFYSSECNLDTLAITTMNITSDSVMESKIMFFNYKKNFKSIDNEFFISFLPDLPGYCTARPGVDSTFEFAIYDFEENYINSFKTWQPFLSFTPGGKYIYTTPGTPFSFDFEVYDSNMNCLFDIPLERPFNAWALSDSLLITVENDLISLWNINKRSKIWQIELPDSSFIVQPHFGIEFSQEHGIAAIRNLQVCHFIDINGSILWSFNYEFGGNYKIGLSPYDTLISFMKGGSSNIEFLLYSLSGEKLTESKVFIGRGAFAFAMYFGDKVVYVDDKLQVARFKGSGSGTGGQDFITGICVNSDDKYVSFVVDGYWQYLRRNESEGTLVGFRNGQSEIVGYSVIVN